jgi:DNA-directed RNA polymerase specialized sigma24 family protein
MNMSYREIAQEIGSNETAVGKRMERLVSKCQTIAEKINL